MAKKSSWLCPKCGKLNKEALVDFDCSEGVVEFSIEGESLQVEDIHDVQLGDISNFLCPYCCSTVEKSELIERAKEWKKMSKIEGRGGDKENE